MFIFILIDVGSICKCLNTDTNLHTSSDRSTDCTLYQNMSYLCSTVALENKQDSF